MYQQELIAYLNNKMEFKEWENYLRDELDFYKKGLKKQGSSIPIRYDGDCQEIIIGKEQIRKLCNDFRNGIIDEYFIGYISDALLLSENSVFESEEIRDTFESLSELVWEVGNAEVRFGQLLCVFSMEILR